MSSPPPWGATFVRIDISNVKPLNAGPPVVSIASVESRFVPRPITTMGASQQIAEQIRLGIMRGELAPGERLPSELELAAEYSVSRGTIRETMKLLSA